MGEENKKVNIQLNNMPTYVVPIFADEVMVGTLVKAVKEGNDVRKEGQVRLNFIDMFRRQSVAEIVISPITARNLVRILEENLNKLEADLKSSELPPQQKIEGGSTENISYIG
jgi:hypothetical protein